MLPLPSKHPRGDPNTPQLEYLSKYFNIRYLYKCKVSSGVVEIVKNGWLFRLFGNDQDWLDLTLLNNKSALKNPDAVDRAIYDLVKHERIIKISPDLVKCLNPLTMVIREDGKERLCIDVSRCLNPRMAQLGFHMVDNEKHFRTFKKGTWMCKLDLKNGYLHIPLHPDVQGYTSFQWKGAFYCYKYMPFGIGLAPLVFQTIMNGILEPLSKDGIICCSYLDDVWIQGNSYQECKEATDKVCAHLLQSNFTINWKKSITTPSQTMEYLGVIYDSVNGQLRLTSNKAKAYRTIIEKLIEHPYLKLFQKVAGFLCSTLVVIPQGKSHLSEIYQNFTGSHAVQDEVLPKTLAELKWWKRTLSSGTGRQCLLPIDEIWHTDASETGCGAARFMQILQTEHDIEYAKLWQGNIPHSNERELCAAYWLIRKYAKQMKNKHIHLKMDNTSAISTINRGGSNKLGLQILRRKMWTIQSKYNIQLSASFIPGKLNFLADALSRQKESGPVDIPYSVKDSIRKSTMDSGIKARKYIPFDPKKYSPQNPSKLFYWSQKGIPTIEQFHETKTHHLIGQNPNIEKRSRSYFWLRF